MGTGLNGERLPFSVYGELWWESGNPMHLFRC